ncbi:DedA family protein [Haloarcula amylovorans]|uniref:DedA family protein n=1 Tax=Haloarcula amylovorans TaxID=2562280 RepID=UPI0010769E66|nr:DedA family protein [Halomicroarcula amylolytica]
MVDATAVALDLLRLYGPLALCLFTFLETSMLFPFLPSEVVVPAAAALLITDPVSLLVFVLAATVGGTVGAFVPFYVCYRTRPGEHGWLRRRIRVSDEQIERGQTWFQRWGQSSVLWGRFLPVLRSVISIPAGFAEMNPAQFGVFTAVGTTGFYAATGALVYYGREESFFEAAFAIAVEKPGLTALVVLVLVGIGLGFGRRSDPVNG